MAVNRYLKMHVYIHVSKARAERAVGCAIQSGTTHRFLSWQLLFAEIKRFGENILDKSRFDSGLKNCPRLIHRHGSIFRTMG